jgi:hypothetical protein
MKNLNTGRIIPTSTKSKKLIFQCTPSEDSPATGQLLLQNLSLHFIVPHSPPVCSQTQYLHALVSVSRNKDSIWLSLRCYKSTAEREAVASELGSCTWTDIRIYVNSGQFALLMPDDLGLVFRSVTCLVYLFICLCLCLCLHGVCSAS